MISSLRLRGAWLGVLIALAASTGCDFGQTSPTAPDQSSVQYSQVDLTVGTGAVAVAGSTVSVQYGIWLYSGTAPDHKGTQLQPGAFSFVLGSNQVIKGFDTGVTGMAVGGTRRVIVPPALAYGTTGNGQDIPPNAALVFDIALTGVQ
jgi:FKBP-type peptidyl-prolyl cis-trans isomerase FkpA